MKLIFLFAAFLLVSVRVWAQSGCTDPQALNYNPEALVNDGSCTYKATALPLTSPKTLPSTLNENSGLIYTDGSLWTLNDSGGGAYIYRISETDGTVLQRVSITGATNTDWEALTADQDYFYIGDFGNNSNGNRTDLRVYRVSKAGIGTAAETSAPAEVIHFRYEEQVIGSSSGSNNTNFDCEAFVVKEGVLHLFTKEWQSHHTTHYTLPATPGTHVAEPVETLAVDGLITGASIAAQDDVLVLIGYTADQLGLFMWLLFDYSADRFFSSNKRRLSLGSTLQGGQLEGVTFTSKGNGYLSNERISSSFFSVSPKLHAFSIAGFVPYPIDQEPLPVELTRFDVAYTAPYITLSWETASERNSGYFSVERSADSITFQEIGQVPAAGNTSVAQTYHFTDSTPYAGLTYYRLKQTDQDGTFSYSRVKQITVPEADMQVSPVPATTGQKLRLELRAGQEKTVSLITLTGADGKTYLQKEVAGTATISEQLPVDHLKRGLYVLKVTNTHHTYTAKVILQ